MPQDSMPYASTEHADESHPGVVRTSPQGSTALTREERTLRAQLAAHESWARTTDRAGRTAAAREGRWKRYLAKAREIHTGHEVTEEFIQEVAEHLRMADMRRMALASAKARRTKTVARKTAARNAGA